MDLFATIAGYGMIAGVAIIFGYVWYVAFHKADPETRN
jgi:hypothetical protein